MIRAILVDDEFPAIERLRKLLRSYPDIDIVGEVQDGLSALSLIEEKKPDLVFLDIDMPELTGLEVARTLGSEGPLIVFATAYDEHALEAFEACAIDYIVKPINSERLALTVQKVRTSLLKNVSKDPINFTPLVQLQTSPTRLAVKIGPKYEILDPSLISAAISQDHYTSFIVDSRQYLSDDSLESILQRLDPTVFIRVHRGGIINIKFLKELRHEGDRKYTAVLNDKAQTNMLISRDRLPGLKKILGLI